MNLIYKATIDGWKYKKFVEKVIDNSPIFVFIRTNYDKTFGGYTEIPYLKHN